LRVVEEIAIGRCRFATIGYSRLVELAERVSTLRRVNGLSARQLAALVDVAPTTVTRIESGAVVPSFDLAQEILAVLGEPIGFTGVADTAAIATARLALDPSLAIPVTAGVAAWRARWARIGLVDASGVAVPGQVPDLLFRAGRVARLTRRPGAVHFEPGRGAYDIADALATADIAHALTGDAGANLYRSSAGEAWPVLYVENVARAVESTGLVRREPKTFGLRVTLIPFDGVCELGRTEVAGVLVAARDQVIMDAYGGIDRMAEQADILLGRRVA
jgi:transcriptional regulator with XRE-family HTH domain